MNIESEKKLLILGPFGDFGGRELEVSFIAKALEENFKISILSTMSYTQKSQLLDFTNLVKLNSLNDLLYNNHTFKFFSFLSFIKNKRKHKTKDYLSNYYNKKLGLRKAAINILRKFVDKNDIVVLCAQISSNYMQEIIDYAYSKDKKIIFRTTNAIKFESNKDLSWLERVDLFIHHSESNASKLSFLKRHHYLIIDQCSYDEDDYLKIKYKHKVDSFVTVSRIVDEKNIDVLVDVFSLKENKNLELSIIGDGDALNYLKRRASNFSNIKFLGFVANNELKSFFEKKDCFIISHYEDEAGPLTGIEAMASGLVIASAKTGAMPDRLPKNKFFFDNTIQDLNKVVQKIIRLKSEEIIKISKYNRNRYLEKYKESEIRSQYKSAIFTVVNG